MSNVAVSRTLQHDAALALRPRCPGTLMIAARAAVKTVPCNPVPHHVNGASDSLPDLRRVQSFVEQLRQ